MRLSGQGVGEEIGVGDHFSRIRVVAVVGVVDWVQEDLKFSDLREREAEDSHGDVEDVDAAHRDGYLDEVFLIQDPDCLFVDLLASGQDSSVAEVVVLV